MAGFEAPRDTLFSKTDLYLFYLGLIAEVSGASLRLLGYEAAVAARSIVSPAFSVEIARGCDATEATALFLAAVLAFPATTRARLAGMAVGTLALQGVNLVRVVGIFCVGSYSMKTFHLVHVEVGQTLFIFLALVVWLVWAWRATQSGSPRVDDSA